MIAGHFGFAAIVKSRETRVPLWSLMLATVWLDIVFIPLLLAGIERLEPVPGLRGGYGQNIIYCRLHPLAHRRIGAVCCIRSDVRMEMGQALRIRAGICFFFSLAA